MALFNPRIFVHEPNIIRMLSRFICLDAHKTEINAQKNCIYDTSHCLGRDSKAKKSFSNGDPQIPKILTFFYTICKFQNVLSTFFEEIMF